MNVDKGTDRESKHFSKTGIVNTNNGKGKYKGNVLYIAISGESKIRAETIEKGSLNVKKTNVNIMKQKIINLDIKRIEIAIG